jgi:hypothetical protein
MNAIDNLVTGFIKINHSYSKTVPSGTLNGTLKDTTTNQSVPTPLASVSVLAVDSDTNLLLTPRSGEQLELWPLPADKPA